MKIFWRTAKKRNSVFVIIAVLFLRFAAFSQYVIQGKVTNENGLALASATINEKAKSNGTATKDDGTFSLNVSSTNSKLIISYVGYSTEEVPVNNRLYINIVLNSITSGLDSVIVIGYGSANKKDLTGAIGSVSEKDFNKGIFTSPDQLIQGKIAGLQITNINGQPGGAAAIKIRGNSALTGTGQPLFVIDGVPLDGRSLEAGNNPLNFINPNDIASFDVLKDASATAIYGSRAAYGVVIITTKKDETGNPKINVNSSIGTSSILRKIKILNAEEYRAAIKYYGVSEINDLGKNSNALDSILQYGLQQDYNLSVAGGNDNGKYRLSINTQNQNGIIINTGLKKYGINLSANFKFLDSRKLGLDVNLNSNQYIQNIPFAQGGASAIIVSALEWNPTDSLYIKSGFPQDPVAATELIKNNLKVTTILSSISPYYQFTNWLEYKLLVSVNYSTGITRFSFNGLLQPNDPRGTASISNNELLTQQITHTLHFNKKVLPQLNLDATAGFEYMKFTSKGFSVSGNGVQGRGFGNYGLDYTNYIQFSDVSGRSISSFADPLTVLQSFFARTIFNYNDKYLLTATFRADGSTKFGANNKYGYFPSVAAAWNINKEKFFKADFINILKIRGSWGKTGNEEFPAGASEAKYSFFDNGIITQVNSPNPNLKWQTDKQYDFGVDFSILNDRISGTVDFYNKTTSDLLFPSVPIQPAPPLSVVRWINLDGKIKNKGLEVLLNGRIISHKKFNWNISCNATFQKNRVYDMPSAVPTGELQGSGVSDTWVETIQNGLPMNAFFTRKFLGFDKSTGLSIYKDDGNTFYYVGNPNPKVLIGFTTTFGYKKFSVTANMYGAFSQDIFNNTLLNVLNVGGINADRNIALSVYKNPIKESIADPVTPSSRFIVKGNYMKMSSLTFNYSIENLANAFKEINIYVIGQNLFLITKYPGFDPESDYDGSINNVPSLGIDYAQYPSSKTVIFGISFSL